jgi:hypothetical protein
VLRRLLIGFAVLGLAAISAGSAGARSDTRRETVHATRSAHSIQPVAGLSIRRALCVRHRRCHRHQRLPGAAGQQSPAAGPTLSDSDPVATTPPTPKDTTPPEFDGLQQAFACTPGPQRPGQTTPFNLSWQAASDNVTPPSLIVYDIYLASTPRGEDYSAPTWTTSPGVTSYRTPGLPSHGSFYFVVRARDQAGNEDDNAVEQHGSDPCL